VHADIKYNKLDGNFYIFDRNSKFGTVVVEQPLTMAIGKVPRAVQIGRTVIDFVVKKKNKSFLDEI
jgi:hypothetical protein